MGYLKFLSPAKVDQVSGEQSVSVTSASAIMSTKDTAGGTEVTVTASAAAVESQGPTRRFSLRSLNFSRRDQAVRKTELSPVQEQEKPKDSPNPSTKPVLKVSSSDKRTQSLALALRSAIVGPASTIALQTTSTVAKLDLSSIKSQLMEPKTANKLIAQLKELPASDDPLHAHKPGAKGPIHAVCLAYTEAEADALHFSKLVSPSSERGLTASVDLPSVVSVSVDKLSAIFNEMNIVHLINAPNLGLGQPGDGEGILSGALPTAQTVIEGIEQITPELMALGYATGKAVMPDHSGIYPPTDRMSVLTYWWGLELLLPPPSLAYLSTAQSITNAVTNFLSALALINEGVREILPFIRYMSQYVDFEFGSIKKQDKGKGVVCAATWIMPAALVPRPWDFPTKPKPLAEPTDTATKPSDIPSASIPHDTPKVPDISSTAPIENSTAAKPETPVMALLSGS